MGDQFERLEAGFGRKLNGHSTRFEHEASIPEMSVPEEPALAANGEPALGVPKSRWGLPGTLKGRSKAGGSASEDAGASKARRGGGLGRRRRSAAEKGGTESGDGLRRIKQAPAKHAPTLGTLNGVLIPTCENMWGVLIFLRFYYIVGNAGIWQSLIIVAVSLLCAMLTCLSLSAIVTNGPAREGGTYFLISRALGPRIGGAVGFMYYLGVSLLAVLEALGAVEVLETSFPALSFPSSNRIFGALIVLFLGLLVLVGLKFVSKLSVVFFGVVLLTMASFYMGLFLAPKGGRPEELTGLSWSTFKSNWGPGYEKGVNFPVALSVFFPCYTGILSGADRANNLKKPQVSVPRGTIGAISLSSVIYVSFMCLWGAVGTRDYLLGNLDRTPSPMMRRLLSGNVDHEVIPDIVWPVAKVTEIGIIIASLAQALQCLITAPKLLQAIANDDIISFLRPMKKLSAKNEPIRALLFTTVLCICFSFIGSLDQVAPLVTVCFLTCYAALNLSCFVLAVLKAPSWRPTWRVFHWSTALVGFLLSFGLMFTVVWYWAVATLVVTVLLYLYIDFRQVQVDWGTGLGGLRLQLAVHSILSVGHESRYSVNWRPQLLVLTKPREVWEAHSHAGDQLLAFSGQLKKGKGLSVVTVIVEGDLNDAQKFREAQWELKDLERRMKKGKVTGFARTLVASSYREGKTYALQASGLGALEPNTLLMGWPHRWADPEHPHNAGNFVETLTQCNTTSKAVLVCMNLHAFPKRAERVEGYIDVWWVVHDGGLLMLLAHLLQQHRVWNKCKLRVHTVSEEWDNPVVVKANLEKLLEQIRIKAEVDVVELTDGDIGPYTFNNTLKFEEAQKYNKELQQIISRSRNPKLDRAFEADSANENTLSSVDAEVLKNALRSGGLPVSKSLPNFDRSEYETSDDGSDDDDESDDVAAPLSLFPGEIGMVKGAENVSRSRNPKLDAAFFRNDHELKEVVVEPGHRGETAHESAHVPKVRLVKSDLSGANGKRAVAERFKDHWNSVDDAEDLDNRLGGGQTNAENRLGGGQTNADDVAGNMGGQRDGFRKGGSFKKDSSAPDLARIPEGGGIHTAGASPLSPSASEEGSAQEEAASKRFGAGKRVQISEEISVIDNESSVQSGKTGGSGSSDYDADRSNENTLGSEENLTMEELNATLMGDPNFKVKSARYPGSPAGRAFDVKPSLLNDTVKERTWSTFTKGGSVSPSPLNRLILEKSANAALVLINLPDPFLNMQPERYMIYCEELTQGLNRVLLVHGSGKEVVARL